MKTRKFALCLAAVFLVAIYINIYVIKKPIENEDLRIQIDVVNLPIDAVYMNEEM